MKFLGKWNERRGVERLIRNGVGVKETRWALPASNFDGESLPLAGHILAWVKEAMGDMRRPNGIDHVAVALACRDEHGNVVCSNSLGVMRPGAFYSQEGADRIAAFLDDVEAVAPQRRKEIVGAVLCLGDVAYALQSARAA